MSAVDSSYIYRPAEPNPAFDDPHVRGELLRMLHPSHPVGRPSESPTSQIERDLVSLVVQLADVIDCQNRRIQVLEELAGPRRVAKEHRRMERAQAAVARTAARKRRHRGLSRP